MKVTGGTPLFFAPEMCGADKTGTNVYSGKAADMWAIGVCIYMWLYHKLPFEAPTQFMLMEAIAAGEITYPEAVEQAPADFAGHGDALMEVMKGLLEPIAQNRLRVRDLRRHVFLTNYGTEPLGEDGCAAPPQGRPAAPGPAPAPPPAPAPRPPPLTRIARSMAPPPPRALLLSSPQLRGNVRSARLPRPSALTIPAHIVLSPPSK